MKIKLKDKSLLFPTLILGVYFLIRLIDQSKLIFTFPLDLTNDTTSYIAQLYFLFKCGFHNLCPYWYNGFITFLNYAPGWAFFTTPIYFLTKHILFATYASVVLSYILAFIFLFYLGKSQKLSFTKIILFFLLLFANPITIGNFIRLGRFPSLLAWSFFIALAGIMLYYKNRPIDRKFFLISILFAIILITHQSEAILSSLLFLSLFLIKNNKEKFLIITSFVFAVLLSSFWTVPFLLEFLKLNSSSEWVFSKTLFDFSGQWLLTNIATLIVPIIFLTTSYFYFKTKVWQKREILFFLPVTLITLFLLSRIVTFIPILNQIYPDEYMFFILFFSSFFLLKSKYTEIIQIFLILALILIFILSVTVSLYHTPWFVGYTSFEKEIVSLTPQISGKFLVLGGTSKTFYEYPFYAYAAIYYNKSTPSGWAHAELDQKRFEDLKSKPLELFNKENCNPFVEHLQKIKTETIITFNEHCNFLQTCGLIKTFEKNNICFYSL